MYAPFFLLFIGLLLGWMSTQGVKSQHIRLVDIFVIGPLMMYTGMQMFQVQPMSRFYALLLIFFGASTLTFNLKNYIFEYRTTKPVVPRQIP